MPPPATPSAEVPRTGAAAAWRTLGRHQIGATAATFVDFGTMILLVEGLGLRPDVATAFGATLGGITNFMLGRAWIFRAHAGRLGSQALRYAAVSAAGAALNSLGEHLVHDRAHVQYVLARALVAIAVSLMWNFPMQREFVFHGGGGAGHHEK
jgi:putative flippase GtrA